VSSQSSIQDHSQRGNGTLGQQFVDIQQQNNIVQHIPQQQNNIVQYMPQQYPPSYHHPHHLPHQPNLFNQERRCNDQQTHYQHHGWHSSSDVGQGYYYHNGFRAERTHQMQQRERTLYPVQQEGHDSYHNGIFHNHAEASYSSRNEHTPRRENDVDNRHSVGNSGQPE